MKAIINHKILVYIISIFLLTIVMAPTIYANSYDQQKSDIIDDTHIQNPKILPREKRIQYGPINYNNLVYLNIPNLTITLNVIYPGPTSYFNSTLSNVPDGYDVVNGSYAGWCIDLNTGITPGHNYSATLYNSYNTTLPSQIQHQNWSKANYIINNKLGSNPMQVQKALWYIFDFGDQGLNADGWAMVNNAALYGANFTPGLGDVIAVIIDIVPPPPQQLSIIEVSIPEFYLNIQTIGNGSVTINPDQTSYLYGSIINLTAQPDTGWSFDGWFGDLTGSTNPVQIIIDDDKAITATFTEDQYILSINTIGNGSVTKNPDQTTYTYGTVVTLTANADLGWSFDGWSGDLTGITNPSTITMDSNKAVTATFTQDQYILNITINGTGNVNIDPFQTYYVYGAQVNLTAQACPWWHFTHWSGDLTGSTNPQTLFMDGDKYVTAHFDIDEYTLSISIDGNGSVIKDPDLTIYSAGTVVNLTAIPDEGWQFVEWTGDMTGSTNPAIIVMGSNKTVSAHFANEYTLEVTVVGQGTVTKNPNQPTYIYETIVELTASPENGWKFSHWEGDLTGSVNPEQILIDGDKIVTAVFIEAPDTTPPSIEITSPENAVYVLAQKILPFKMPFIFLGVKVTVNASDEDSGIERIEFYIDDVLVENVTEAPYEFNWKRSESFKIKRTIKAIAYDNAGNEAFDELEVMRWRFHPLLIAFFLFIAAVKQRFGN
jgi:uncharacterized repeat protein (TIGR02543 family)